MRIFSTLIALISGAKDDDQKRYDESRRRIRGMSVEAARAATLNLLNDSAKFDVVVAHSRWSPEIKGLGRAIIEFFDQFDRVQATHGDMLLSRSDIAPSDMLRDYIRIGRDAEHAEVLTISGSDKIYVADGTEADPNEDWYPSIFHYVLAVADDLYG